MRRPMPPLAAAMALGILSIYILDEKTEVIRGLQRLASDSISVARIILAMSIIIAAVLASVLSLPKNAGMKDTGLKNTCRLRSGIILAAVLFFAGGCVMMSVSIMTALPAPSSNAEIEGTVLKVTVKDSDDISFVVTTDNGRILVRCYDGSIVTGPEKAYSGQGKTGVINGGGTTAYALAGTRVLVKGELSLPKERRNPGCFDYRRHLRGSKILAVMTASSIDGIRGNLPTDLPGKLQNKLYSFRARIEAAASEKMSKDGAAMFSAMMFGDKSGLDEDIYESFQRNGTAHILAVSGLHVGMVYALLLSVIGGKRKKVTNISILAALICYAALSGFAASVVRAVIMISLHIIAKLTDRKYDILSAASFTAVLMMAYEPYSLFQTGFQMSFLAAVTISFLFPLIEKTKLPKAVKTTLLPVVLIQAGTAPYSAFVFNYFSFGSFIANIPIVFLAGIIVPAGVICMAAAALIPGLSSPVFHFEDAACSLMEECNDMFYAQGASSVSIESPPLMLLLLYYALLFGVSSEAFRIAAGRKQKEKLLKSVLVAILCILAAGTAFRNEFLSADCVFVDVGQGACVHMRTPSGKNILIDGGGKPSFGEEDEKYDYDVGKKILIPYLLKNRAGKIDIAFVTHLDADHFEGICAAAKAGMVKKIAVHECLRDEGTTIAEKTGMDEKDIVFLRTGQVISEKGFRLVVVGPVEQGTADNSNSLVIRSDFAFGRGHESVSVLVTGDIDEETESALVSKYRNTGSRRVAADVLDTDIVQVPHHGSRYSSSAGFIEAVSPKVAVCQVGKNNYGHPADEIIDRYVNKGCAFLRNDMNGAVGVFGKRLECVIHSVDNRRI